jgi:hypothetical protein
MESGSGGSGCLSKMERNSVEGVLIIEVPFSVLELMPRTETSG